MNAITCMTWMKKGLKPWVPKIMENDGVSVNRYENMEEVDEEEEDSGEKNVHFYLEYNN